MFGASWGEDANSPILIQNAKITGFLYGHRFPFGPFLLRARIAMTLILLKPSSTSLFYICFKIGFASLSVPNVVKQLNSTNTSNTLPNPVW